MYRILWHTSSMGLATGTLWGHRLALSHCSAAVDAVVPLSAAAPLPCGAAVPASAAAQPDKRVRAPPYSTSSRVPQPSWARPSKEESRYMRNGIVARLLFLFRIYVKFYFSRYRKTSRCVGSNTRPPCRHRTHSPSRPQPFARRRREPPSRPQPFARHRRALPSRPQPLPRRHRAPPSRPQPLARRRRAPPSRPQPLPRCRRAPPSGGLVSATLTL